MTLPTRYRTPYAESAFSDKSKIADWAIISNEYATRAAEGFGTEDDSRDVHTYSAEFIRRIYANDEILQEWGEAEALVGHEVVAFLQVYLRNMPERLHRYVHYGLTSSDLVEYSLHHALRNHAGGMVWYVQPIKDMLRKKFEGMRTIRAGRTHGQVAAWTSLNHQFGVQAEVFHRLERELAEMDMSMRVVKSPGPTGRTHIPQRMFDAMDIASENIGVVVPSTQVIPRDYLLEWATVYLRLAAALENLALQIRLGSRSEIGELREGAADDRQGSSAMPGKKNPIDSEKVCGLARVARGYFASLAEGSALWEDRDLTNSSLERVAVVGLAQTVEHMLMTMHNVLDDLVVDFLRMEKNLDNAATQVHAEQAAAQKVFGIGPLEASRLIDTEGAHRLMVDRFGQGAYDEWARDVAQTMTNLGLLPESGLQVDQPLPFED